MQTTSQAAPLESGLDPQAFVPLKLKKRSKYNHNTDIFVFSLPNSDSSLNLPVSSFLVTKFTGADGKDVIRPYTPIDQHLRGELHLLVKEYAAGVMSKHIHNLKVGDELLIKGPMPKYAYSSNHKRALGFVAGGTGITPCLQIIEEVLSNPNDKTEISLVFANQTPADVLLKERLDSLSAAHPQLRVTYVVDQPTAAWTGATGYVNRDLLSKTMPQPSGDGKDVMIFTCGPPGFLAATSGTKTPDYKQGQVGGALKELGYNEENVFKL